MEIPFQKIIPEQITENVFKQIDKQWMLITAGNLQSFNTMTASWGNLGILWNKPTATIFVRPTRHTYQFVEENLHFTLSFFDDKYRKILNFCGSHSGRNTNKVDATGLKPIVSEQ